ncbi:RAC-beta serine/threonine-protein kinase, partial [Stylosanthes scabra]|nr:RAC-beta serine/threonine-protein kinase [Stylosanthes scabra]
MKEKYLPPRKDIIMLNKVQNDVYIIVSGEVEFIDCVMKKDCLGDPTNRRHVWRG